MKIGVPKEIKANEGRVGMTPSGVNEMIKAGHSVYIQQNAGVMSGFKDYEYVNVGAEILETIEEVYAIADMIVKVKEPLEKEYSLIREKQIVFTYFHFASCQPLTQAMIESKATCITYETIEDRNGTLPLLTPMSEVAGRMSIQQGAKYLESPMSGKGILLGGVPGVRPANVLVLGGGVVGTQAAKMAAGLGANVTIMDINANRLRYLDDVMPANVNTEFSSEYAIKKALKNVDLLIGAVLIPGALAPKLITGEMLKDIPDGSVIVDVAVDQGGCFETTRATSHKEPTYIIDNVVHYCVANIPGAVPYTSTQALTNVTLPYALKIANNGWKKACNQDEGLKKGLNIVNGKVVYKAVSDTFDLPFHNVEEVF